MVKIRFHRGHGAILITNIWQETIQRSTEKRQKSGKNIFNFMPKVAYQETSI